MLFRGRWRERAGVRASGIAEPVEGVGSGFEEGAAAGGIKVDAGGALHGARITPLVNLRRLDGNALAAMGTDERDQFVHAGVAAGSWINLRAGWGRHRFHKKARRAGTPPCCTGVLRGAD